jgi:predicted acyltransferase
VKAAAQRLESLDVFRGLTIFAMIVVNNPGDWSAVVPPLLHAYWHGCTFADVLFPWFIFIMGFAMPFAFARRRDRGHAHARLYRRIAQRMALLMLLGLALNAAAAWPAIAPLRFPGVLQRLAAAYLIASLAVLRFEPKAWAVAVGVVLAGHWAALALVPFGGHAGGSIGPDHNLAGYLDAMVFGRHAMTTPIDPEGLLGTLPAAATALLGALTGELVRNSSPASARLPQLAAGGALALAAGLGWSRVLPLNKHLWTGSFVLVTAGLAMLAFGLIYVAVDVFGLRSWARPFIWLGVNPLAIYCGSEFIGHMLDATWLHRTTPKAWLFWGVLQPALNFRFAVWASLAFAVAYASLWTGVAGVLYQRGVRIQV